MIKDFVKNLLDDNEKDIKRMRKTVQIINSLEPQFQALAEEDFQAKTAEFRHRI